MLPDVLGYRLEKGKEVLLSKGFSNINITITRSPFNSENPSDRNYRILKAEEMERDEVRLLVCPM